MRLLTVAALVALLAIVILAVGYVLIPPVALGLMFGWLIL